MAKIRLNLNMLIDDEDVHLLQDKTVYIGFRKGKGYPFVIINNKQIAVHRIIMDAKDGDAKDGDVVDHINGNTTDNRRSNLRSVTTQQNLFNSYVQKNKLSGLPKGITFIDGERSKPYRVRLTIDGIVKSLGVYVTIENALEAYNKAIKKHHGEYAKVIDSE